MACHSTTIGTTFFAQLSVQPPTTFVVPIHQQNAAQRLHYAIDQVRTQPGHSRLSVVSYAQEDDSGKAILYRFRLENPADLSSEPPTQNFELTVTEYRQMVTADTGSEWIANLDELITRSSERAFLEVKKTYSAGNGIDTIFEAARWDDDWARMLPRPVEQLFMARLDPVTMEDLEQMEGTAGSADALIQVRLPCKHLIGTSKAELDSLSSQMMLDHICPQCGSRTLQDEEQPEIMLRTAIERADEYKHLNESWTSLDNDEPVEGAHQISFSPATLLESLDTALHSLNTPPLTMTPPNLNPVSFSETRAVNAHFESVIRAAGDEIKTTPAELLRQLHDTADGAHRIDIEEQHLLVSQTMVPPTFDEFKNIWFRRTVGHLVDLLALDGTRDDSDSESDGVDATLMEIEVRMDEQLDLDGTGNVQQLLEFGAAENDVGDAENDVEEALLEAQERTEGIQL
ncbi:uncharacterized protein LTR77_005796 [Saxophila tyrrhenica]|uniref:Uncharacterized protein n=1 Tax=Saxophila tyrrhenica TaxID=1690608 RepID=A0AAV9PAA7_9PEZI|nr:hypothetical protein LTR77_005796 [Saxophila tyrrhenica]